MVDTPPPHSFIRLRKLFEPVSVAETNVTGAEQNRTNSVFPNSLVLKPYKLGMYSALYTNNYINQGNHSLNK